MVIRISLLYLCLFEIILPVVLLLYLLVNTAYLFLVRPYTGINVDMTSGVVTDVNMLIGKSEMDLTLK